MGASVNRVVAVDRIVENVEQHTASNDRLTSDERRWAWAGALAAVVVFLLLATCMQPWRLFDQARFSSDFYDVQARALAHGRIDVPPEVVGIEGFVINGKTQIYFGIGPALMRIPLTGWTDMFDRRLALLSQLLAVLVLGLAAARLLKRGRSLVRDAPGGSAWWFGAVAFTASICTPLLFFASRPLVYHEAQLWGAAAGLAGLDLVLRWWREPTRKHLLAAIALATFAMSCRPSTGASPAVALGIFGLVLLYRREWKHACVVVAGAILPVAVFCFVNWLRFGSLTQVPFPLQVFSTYNADRKALLEANNGSFFSIQNIPTSFVQYFSPLALRAQRLFPFVGWGPKATLFGDARFDTVDHSGSITTGAPLFMVFAIIGAWWTIVRDRTRQWSVLMIAAIVPLVTTFTFAYIAHRYLADLVPVVVILAIPGIWLLARRLSNSSKIVRRVTVGAFAVLALLGMWGQIGLALQSRAFSIVPTPEEIRDFVDLQYSIDDALFGGTAPFVTVLNGTQLPDAPDGAVVILGDCYGAYHFDGYGWGAFERRATPGSFRQLLTGNIEGMSSQLAAGDDWELRVMHSTEGTEILYINQTNGQTYSSGPTNLSGEVTLDVVADPAVGVLTVKFGKQTLLEVAHEPVGGLVAGPGWTSTEVAAPLCESLKSRAQ